MIKICPLTFIVAIILAIFNLFYFTGCSGGQTIEISLSQPVLPNKTTQIYIGGAINNPGYYTLKEEDTVKNLIQAAGGVTANSDISQLELTINQPDDQSQKIDINRAGAWLLEALPGIGETRAQAIIQYRTENGNFKNINELLDVDGIGQETFANIKDLITVDD
jgi:competence protein ComEA